MTDLSDAKDSATGWVAEHTRRYIETDGAVGHRWNGLDCLVLMTRGRRTGDLRRNALIYGTDGPNHVVVGSAGGQDLHPHWYLNLLAEPRVRIQVGAERFDVVARVASGEERERLWAVMTGVFPTYVGYQRKTDREIPVVVLEPVSSG